MLLCFLQMFLLNNNNDDNNDKKKNYVEKNKNFKKYVIN